MINPLNLLIRPATVYQFVELLSKPFNQFDSYRKGLINESGKIIAKSGDLDGLEYIALRVKSLFKDLTPGMNKSLLNSLTGTLTLFNEEFNQMGLDRNEINLAIERYVFCESNGKMSYLDFLLEEATHRYINEDMSVGMVSGGDASLGMPAMITLQGGIAGYDKPLAAKVFRRKKKKKSRKIVEQIMSNPADQAPVDPYLTLQLDPIDYEEVLRSNTPSGIFDPSQLTNSEMKKYFKRLGERSKKKQLFVVGNEQQPPKMLKLY